MFALFNKEKFYKICKVELSRKFFFLKKLAKTLYVFFQTFVQF